MSLMRFIRGVSFTVLLFIFGVLFILKPVIAQEEVNLQLSPAIIDVNGVSGKRINTVIKLTNISATPLAVSAYSRSLTPEDTPIDESAVDRYDASLWVNLPIKDYLIAAKDTIDVEIEVNIPADAVPGGHYALVVFRLVNDTDIGGSGVQVNSEAASVMLISVPGDIDESLEISEQSGSYINLGNQLKFSQEVMNTGNTHVTPIITTEIISGSGKVVDTITQPVQLLLPNTKREIGINWSSKSGYGKFIARTTVSYGTPTQTVSSQNYDFYIAPSAQQLIFWIFTLVVVIILTTKRWYKRKLLRVKAEKPSKKPSKT